MAEEGTTIISDDKQNAESSTASTQQTAQPSSEGGDLLGDAFMSKVDDLLKKHTEKSDGESSAPAEETEVVEGGKEEPTSEAPVEGKDKVEVVEEVKEPQVPFHNHPRWKEVLKERDEARSVLDKTKAEVDALRPQAEGFVSLQQYCQKHNINDNEVQEALDLLALSKSDTKAFRARLQTYADVIDFAQGTRLPQDLQEKVDAGVLPEAEAQELSRYRLQKEHLVRSNTASQEAVHQANVQQVTTAINAWHLDNAKRDPGFNEPERLQMLTDRIHYLWNAKQPTDVKSAIALAEQANVDVKARLAKLRPVPPVRKVLPNNGSSVKPKAVSQIQSMDELEKVMFDYGSKRLAARKA